MARHAILPLALLVGAASSAGGCSSPLGPTDGGCSGVACLDGAPPDAPGPPDAALDGGRDAGGADAGPAILSVVRGLSAGNAHTCAVAGAGLEQRVLCWGDNQFGQLGADTMGPDPVPEPVEVEGLDGPAVDEVFAGGVHTCARMASGVLRCWGSNVRGQAGVGVATLWVPSPTTVRSVTAATVAMGGAHTCVTQPMDDARCWGAGEDGQLGDGGSADSGFPVVFALDVRPFRLAAGDFHTCALTAAGTVVCVGRDSHGQLGHGPGSPEIADAVDVVAGRNHTCVIRADGSLWCWGNNGDGQLGDGTTTETPTRRQVPGIDGVTQVATRANHTCALRADDSLWCWGRNGDGQALPGGPGNQLVPADTGLLGVQRVAAGAAHTCALVDGQVTCFGDDTRGQLGDGPADSTGTRTAVIAP